MNTVLCLSAIVSERLCPAFQGAAPRLKLEHISLDAAYMDEYDLLAEENEWLEALLKERERVLSEIMGLYDVASTSDEATRLAQIETFKKEHNCTDDEAGKVFGLSRRTILRMRKEQKTLQEELSV